MAIPQRIAVSLPVPPDVTSTLSFAEWAEYEGFDDVWFADGGSIDSLTLAAAVALRTQRVRIGTAVIPVYTRTPAVLAATAATISHLAPDRFILGLGSSSHAMIEGWHGVPFVRPLTRVKETAQLVRGMLAGEKSDFDGATLRSQGYRLGLEPKGHVPIYLAALRQNMLELAGELGEGVVVNLFPAEALPRMLEHVEIGARRAGSSLAKREVVCRHQVIITSDKPAAREVFRKHFAPYYATPVYNKFLAWCGYEEAAATIEAGWREKNRDKTGGALSDELIDRIAIIGTMAECQERVRELARGGVTTHVIHSTLPDPYSVRAVLEAFSPRSFQLP
ncbi:MAG TPA: LLM class flavin-dependent oxidoreductase [bacterium]|nr:LLM class flavin-dependent oxidoreductase [bacterium]